MTAMLRTSCRSTNTRNAYIASPPLKAFLDGPSTPRYSAADEHEAEDTAARSDGSCTRRGHPRHRAETLRDRALRVDLSRDTSAADLQPSLQVSATRGTECVVDEADVRRRTRREGVRRLALQRGRVAASASVSEHGNREEVAPLARLHRLNAIYNEIDPGAAAWLKGLADADRIVPGRVDTRSVEDLTRADVDGPGQRHFFAGIGGWSLALRYAGVDDGADIWTGSCPCQPFSQAGRRKGNDDARHLWPACRLVASEHRTKDSACSSWPTPTRAASGNGYTYREGNHDEKCLTLIGAARLASWTTPRASDEIRGNGESSISSERGTDLVTQVHLTTWSTPAVKEAGGTPEQFLDRKRKAVANGSSLGVSLTSLSLQAQLADTGSMPTGSSAATAKPGQLNPEHSRWLMGYPAEWGKFAVTETRLTRSSAASSSKPRSRRSKKAG